VRLKKGRKEQNSPSKTQKGLEKVDDDGGRYTLKEILLKKIVSR